MKPESAKETTESAKPKAISNISPETKMLLTSSARPSALYWAEQRIIAEFTPQSLNIPIRVGAVKIIEYNPYWSEPSSLAMKMVPTDEMSVDNTSPHSRWKPPLAETLAMSAALLM